MKRNDSKTFEEFNTQVKRLHHLDNLQFLISYIDPRDNDLLPINNDDNFGRAITIAKPLLRIIIQRKGIIFLVCFFLLFIFLLTTNNPIIQI